MNKRRINQDDPQISPSKSIEMSIFNSSDNEMTTILQTIKENIFNFEKIISNALLQCAMDLPHKTNFYVRIMRELATDNRFLISIIIESMLQLTVDDWRRLSQLFRLIVTMTNYGLFTINDLNNYFGELFEIWNGDESYSYEKWCICTCLGLLPHNIAVEYWKRLYPNTSFINQNENDQIDHNDDNIAFDPKSILRNEFSNWNDPIIEDPIEIPFTIPNFDWSNKSINRDPCWNVSLFEDQVPFLSFDKSKNIDNGKNDDNEMKPSWSKWNNRYCINVIMENFRHNHRVCSDIISKMPISEKELARILFNALLRIRPLNIKNNISNQVLYFEVLLIDICTKLKSFPPVFAKTVHEMLSMLSVYPFTMASVQNDDNINVNDNKNLCFIENSNYLGFVKISRLADFLAFQLSNFDFKWAWESLGKLLKEEEERESTSAPVSAFNSSSNADEVGNKRGKNESNHVNIKKFVEILLQRLLDLSYREKIESIIPDWAKPLLPAKIGITEESNPIVNAMLVRSNPQDLLNRIKDSGINTVTPVIFIKCLLTVGYRTSSHVQSLMEKYLSTLLYLNPKSDREARMGTLDGVREFFFLSNYIQYEHALLRLLQYRIVLPEDVLYHLIESVDDISNSYHCLLLVLRQIVGMSSFVTTSNSQDHVNSDIIMKMEIEADNSINLAINLLEEREKYHQEELFTLLDIKNAIKKLYPIK